eukprot:4855518-Pleurochrysis_carterae.AAC.1
MPYTLAFGQHPRCGLSALLFSPELLDKLTAEADLNKSIGLDADANIEEVYISDLDNEAAARFLAEQGWSFVPPGAASSSA